MSPELSAFVNAARAFCASVEGPPGEQHVERWARLLARLYAAGVDLEDVDAGEGDVERFRPLTRPAVALRVRFYAEALDPLEIESPELAVGDLDDDLGDVYGDVKAGLNALDAGHVDDAAWTWRFHFEVHWGDHASDALRVLHRLLVQARRT